MKREVILPLVLNFILLSILSGCDWTPSATESPGSVTFTIPIQVENFSETGSLRIVLWDTDQLEIMARTADCAISIDLESQTEEVHCPEGVEYEEVTPEEFAIPLQEIGEFVTVESSNIQVGERYRLLVSGLSKDDCNRTSADVAGVALTTLITVEDLEWMTTLMACP